MTLLRRIGAFALTLSLATLAWCGGASAQVSPGPLATPHASVDGSLACLKCHGKGGGKAGMDERCLACHTEIGWMRTAKRGTHAKVTDKNCSSCHPDHGGRDFRLVNWDAGGPEKFDHKRAGFELRGKHASIKCVDCHKAALQKSPAAPLIRKKDRGTSYLGLQTGCLDCHKDTHRGQLGRDCEKCHGVEKFKPVENFDHSKARFALTGKHAKLDCMKCHASPQVVKARDEKGQPLPEWKPLKFADCVACHKDPHAGRFPGACAKCHTTEDFHTISRTGFNHDLTRYPLKGKHALADCAKCHDPRRGGFGAKPKFAACTDCHKDQHNGTATLAGKVVDCASCHDLSGFDRSIYTVAMHAKSAYSLVGKHVAAPCEGCHVKKAAGSPEAVALGGSRVVLRPKKAACADCHGDPHLGRFEPGGARPAKNSCQSCHSLAAYHPSTYDGRAHADCVFPLQGAHMAIPCQSCHEELAGAPAKSTLAANLAAMRPLRFDNPKRLCIDCHSSPHGVQFSQRKDKGACDACHDDKSFTPVSKFDHSRDSSFKLEGAHAKAPCASCHLPQKDTSGKTTVIYRQTPTKCEACHVGGTPDLLTPENRKSQVVPPRTEARGLLLLTSREALHGTH